ncbi:MAG: hypothetical protein GXO87_08765 [Chlorobi bacterium]|nr:hypothetical protein [Chlorobiota bacterium]
MTEKEFLQNWIDKIRRDILKDFPADFIADEAAKDFELPGAALTLGAELFGSYELNDIDGNPAFQLDSYEKAKYVLYANRTEPKSIKIPNDERDLKRLVEEYEKHLDVLLRLVKDDYEINFPEGARFMNISNSIFYALNLYRY